MAVEATEANFDLEVIQKSAETPVLVDFWAEWCGPCRMLGPLLDKLEAEYQGRFMLAKLNTDLNQNLAAEYNISGIPAVKLFKDGRTIDEFVGALPEQQLRDFLDKNLPNPGLQELEILAAKDPIGAAHEALKKKLSGEAAEAIIWQGAIHLLVLDKKPRLDELKSLLSAVPEAGSRYSEARNSVLAFLDRTTEGEGLARLAEIFYEESQRKALDFFLARIENASAGERNAVKDDLLTCFYLLGNQGALVNEYRRKLSALLF